jgi:hypothetical protein
VRCPFLGCVVAGRIVACFELPYVATVHYVPAEAFGILSRPLHALINREGAIERWILWWSSVFTRLVFFFLRFGSSMHVLIDRLGHPGTRTHPNISSQLLNNSICLNTLVDQNHFSSSAFSFQLMVTKVLPSYSTLRMILVYLAPLRTTRLLRAQRAGQEWPEFSCGPSPRRPFGYQRVHRQRHKKRLRYPVTLDKTHFSFPPKLFDLYNPINVKVYYLTHLALNPRL